VPHAPHIAVSATPWPGSVAVWSAQEDAGYALNLSVTTPAVVGRTESVLSAGRSGLWDRGEPLRVRIFAGVLSSASELAVLNGANAMAIGDGSTDRWEVFQFATATLVAPETYDLSLRLRGQLGSDALMPAAWPVGSRVVLLGGALSQIELASSARGLARHYRIGTAARGYDDPAVVHQVAAFAGIGLRPYAPVHLAAARIPNGDLALHWIRRTRIDGDSWMSVEVPLGEDHESYLVRVFRGGELVREQVVAVPEWLYPTALQVDDGLSGAFRIEGAQVSDRFGPGLFRGLDLFA